MQSGPPQQHCPTFSFNLALALKASLATMMGTSKSILPNNVKGCNPKIQFANFIRTSVVRDKKLEDQGSERLKQGSIGVTFEIFHSDIQPMTVAVHQ